MGRKRKMAGPTSPTPVARNLRSNTRIEESGAVTAVSQVENQGGPQRLNIYAKANVIGQVVAALQGHEELEHLRQTQFAGLLIFRTISPYDLTAANPGAVISHPFLKGSNYDDGAIGLKTALSSRRKFCFLDGSIARPADGSSNHDDWWTIQALLVSWIKMTIDPALRSNISHRDVAKDLWDHLKKRFTVTNRPRINQLKAELVVSSSVDLPLTLTMER
ncbi:unnamed protein product [Microthlaspi erraticum]|uniref:Retrotransposon Copia-like N-terminal domain-containing protein n=1 Tax=Microthlaspi erraticum TaxID=1685480 RepID=A0A6D2K0T9_9BRAS|nr:unnamed protein product [Microthlaspi erraticum]